MIVELLTFVAISENVDVHLNGKQCIHSVSQMIWDLNRNRSTQRHLPELYSEVNYKYSNEKTTDASEWIDGLVEF